MRKTFYLLVLAIAFVSCQEQKVGLALNLKKGKEYKQVVNSKSTIIQDIDGQKMNMEMTIKGGMVYKVLSVDSSYYDLEVIYENLSLTMEVHQAKMEFRSDKNDKEDMASTMLSKMVGKPFYVKMAKNGKILEIKNIESIFESVFEDFNYIPESQLAQMKSQMIKAYGRDSFKGNIEMVTAIFPDNIVSEGDNWTIKTNLKSGMAALLTTEYEFTELGSNYILIKGNSVIETEDQDALFNPNGMPTKYELTGSMISDIKIDKESGWIIEANMNQKIKGKASIKANPKLPDGMKIPMNIKNEITVTNE